MWTRARSCDRYCERIGLRDHPGAVAVLRGVRAVPARRDRPADLVPLLPRADHNEAYAVFGPAVGYLETALPRRLLGGAWTLMGVVLLVRHGQASFGADDYDVLVRDRAGAEPAARVPGWPRGGVTPDAGAARRDAPAPRDRRRRWLERRRLGRADVEVDAGWNEFDHLGVVARCPRSPAAAAPTRARPPRLPAALRAGHRPLDRRRARRRLRRVVAGVRGPGRVPRWTAPARRDGPVARWWSAPAARSPPPARPWSTPDGDDPRGLRAAVGTLQHRDRQRLRHPRASSAPPAAGC